MALRIGQAVATNVEALRGAMGRDKGIDDTKPILDAIFGKGTRLMRDTVVVYAIAYGVHARPPGTERDLLSTSKRLTTYSAKHFSRPPDTLGAEMDAVTGAVATEGLVFPLSSAETPTLFIAFLMACAPHLGPAARSKSTLSRSTNPFEEIPLVFAPVMGTSGDDILVLLAAADEVAPFLTDDQRITLWTILSKRIDGIRSMPTHQ